MKKVSFLAAAAAVTALVVTPALAQDTAKPRPAMQGKTDKQIKHMKQGSKQTKPKSSKQTKPMRHSARMQSRDGTYMRSAAQDRGPDNRNTGFWPGNVVAGAVGTAGAIAATAVGTAGSIATAPFGGPYRDSYAYGPGYVETYSYNGIAMPYSPNYAARNGFTCQPGTFIKDTRTLCQ